ncbi:MAG: SDR family NAD(P)-dependent oxidoreductase [Treponema sp.]|jgi:sorbitol-6-phosphate 2-dehydrogenase|nr:SDR family NAD(P)-dependent oxidoreductase [Treponema sp.]
MKNEALLALLLRGALIEKTGYPWTISFEQAKINLTTDLKIDLGDLSITIENERQIIEAREKIARAINNYVPGKSPVSIWVKCNKNNYGYICASDTEKPAKTDFGISRSLAVKNRIVLVTGGAQGFGEEITRGLVSAGALVFIADLNIEGAEKLAETINREQGKTAAFPAEVNVADEASVEKMVETIALTAGGLDLCVSNAGVLRAAAILEQDINSFKFVTDINYTAFAVVTKHCGLLMRAQNLCAPSWMTDIIQINSKSGLDGSNKNGAYAGSKFGSIGLVQSFAKELVEYRIKVNAVCPGNFFVGSLWADPAKGLFVQYLKTGKVPGAKTIEDVKAFYEAKVPMGRGCTGPDVIRAVLYLVEQVYETGQALPVTGGQVMLG